MWKSEAMSISESESQIYAVKMKRSTPEIVLIAAGNDLPASMNPRRVAANRSVSLLHKRKAAPKRKSAPFSGGGNVEESSASDERTSTSSPSSLQALGGICSSGETSNAENWFDKSNNHVQNAGPSLVDNDPPFFMRHSSSEETPLGPEQTKECLHGGRTDSRPLQAELLQLGTDGSSTEDYRGVIDDLTVENKRLKSRLKRYEKLHDNHLKDDKLFEIRIHGLPADKKRELEETLRKFASSLGSSEAEAFPSGGYSSLVPTLKNPKATSSQASLQHPDSAYASMSASGPGSAALSGNDSQQKATPTQYAATRRQNIQSYLHDIPEGLLPRQNPTSTSEQAKKKMVVRRLEHLFAGRGAATGGHQQSLQQEEISMNAAKNDRLAKDTAGNRRRSEGSREARIMEHETEDPLDLEQGVDRTHVGVEGGHQTNTGGFLTNEADIEQRPTRPLDLDPQRAQVPAENVQYMRRLGFSPIDPELGGTIQHGHGWIYLNFLINMAQLHTINVTTEFVRKALGDYSDRFQISSDGRKVRWKGGSALTRNSSGEGSPESHADNEMAESPRKRVKLTHTGSHPAIVTPGLRSVGAKGRSESQRHVYTPMFTHRDSTDESDDSSSEQAESDNASPLLAPPAVGQSSAMASSGIQTSFGPNQALTKKRKQKADEGPIVFYSNAKFFTDFSGDQNPDTKHHAPTYVPATACPIGKTLRRNSKILEERGTLAKAVELPESTALHAVPLLSPNELSFPPWEPSSEPSPCDGAVEFEASGIGGVWPADNFAVSVQMRHARLAEQHASLSVLSEAPILKSYKSPIALSLSQPRRKYESLPMFGNHRLGARVQRLPPSQLPAALNLYSPDEEDSDDELDDDTSGPPNSIAAFFPSTAPQSANFALDVSEDEEEDDSDRDSDDGEVDLLAGIRQIDPEVVREKEREYDANMAERLAEVIPTGSSAATAGGGSGFVSPAKGVEREEYQRAIWNARSASLRLRRESTGDSMVVHMRDDSSDNDSDDDMSDIKS